MKPAPVNVFRIAGGSVRPSERMVLDVGCWINWDDSPPSRWDDLAYSAATLPDRPRRLEMDSWHHWSGGCGGGGRALLIGRSRADCQEGPCAVSVMLPTKCSSFHSLIGQKWELRLWHHILLPYWIYSHVQATLPLKRCTSWFTSLNPQHHCPLPRTSEWRPTSLTKLSPLLVPSFQFRACSRFGHRTFAHAISLTETLLLPFSLPT